MPRRPAWSLLLLLPVIALAATPAPTGKRTALPADPTEDPAMVAAGFLDSHPDLRHRKLGMAAYADNDHALALEHLRRAARYGDKPSQALVAEMLWNGLGTAQDRVLGYVWMDLAAERGYAPFVTMRESYWSRLERAERLRVAAAGEAVYADYGDAVAEPRLATVLRRARRNVTGSRTGMVGNVKILIPGPGGLEDDASSIDAATFYHPRYWDPVQYRAWQDSIWMNPRLSTVTVGAASAAGTTTPATPVPPADAGEDTQPRPATAPPEG